MWYLLEFLYQYFCQTTDKLQTNQHSTVLSTVYWRCDKLNGSQLIRFIGRQILEPDHHS